MTTKENTPAAAEVVRRPTYADAQRPSTPTEKAQCNRSGSIADTRRVYTDWLAALRSGVLPIDESDEALIEAAIARSEGQRRGEEE